MLKKNSKATNRKARASKKSKPDKKSKAGQEEHPLALALDVFLHKCEDIKLAAKIFVNVAAQFQQKQQDDLYKQYEGGKALMDKNDENYSAGMRQSQKAILHLSHVQKSKLPSVIESSLFLRLFSAFDAFTGDLLSAIYKGKPELFETLDRTIKVSEILQYESFENLQDIVLREQIENFRRGSYVDQFKELENLFGLKLRAFENWPSFVECSQRRNLFTHCDGEVSQQYLDVCEKEGYKFKKKPAIGNQLGLGPNYFLPACDLLAEVAVKLCHTLWRKLFPDELKKADEELNAAIYERLEFEEYERASIYAKFALTQPKFSSDLNRRVFLVNHAIALKFSGKSSEAQSLLKQEDWSACSPDVKIAEVVLLDKFDEADKLMRKIGKKGEILCEEYYHSWPLFKNFRTSPQFQKAYKDIFGRPFIIELKKPIENGQPTSDKDKSGESK